MGQTHVETANYTPFGKYLALHKIPATDAERALGITRSYISMLTTGRATPGLRLAYQIEQWTEGEVPMTAWLEWGLGS